MKHTHLVLAVGVLGVAASAACSTTDDPPLSNSRKQELAAQEEPAVKAFFGAFHSARYSQSAAAAAALDQAVAADPTSARVAFDSALAHTWHVSEAGRDPRADPMALRAESETLFAQLVNAQKLAPDDARIGCFIGTTAVRAGRAMRDAALVQRGYDVLDQAVAAWPEFNYFCKALGYDDLPATDPDFQKAVESVYANMDVCFGEKVDRDNPDITKYLPQYTDDGPKRVCWNDWIAPHNAEGYYLYMGDVLVKAGRLAAARVAYRNAQLVPDYGSWPYKPLVEERLASDLTAKAAVYRDDNPLNDPPPGGAAHNRACAVCHATTAAE